ncbi:putative RNA methyltransferase [Lactococcus fujiensis]|uniref:putative RNA methyltransferase n=1 Tax=Lactococcus fujiensis TaxID=610251 RepID=UPI000BDF05F7|nr:methyltransferase domain-containing protein [Lactococcus fujiensis]
MKIELKCPVCNRPLRQDERVFICPQSHSFDLAKEGYLNLLLNAKPTAGDSKAMMNARRKFLAAGYYEQLSNAVNLKISQAIAAQADAHAIVDIGCGEGYYLSRFQTQHPSEKLQYFGLDISKLGIKMAAKKSPQIQWLVANFAHLPFMDHSADVILSMFAEYSVAEMNRICSDQGIIILVRAGDNHLIELKNVIYPEIHEKERLDSIKPFPNFKVERQEVTFKTTITNNEDLMSLLLMTPHYWKIKSEGLDNLKKLKSLTVTVSIEIDYISRNNSNQI